MQLRPRLQLIAPAQVTLLSDRSIGLEDFKKGDVVTIEQFHADKLIEGGFATSVKEDGVESVNRWEQVKDKTTKKQEALNEALAEAAKEPAAAQVKSATQKTDEPLVAADSDKAGVSTKVTRSNPQA